MKNEKKSEKTDFKIFGHKGKNQNDKLNEFIKNEEVLGFVEIVELESEKGCWNCTFKNICYAHKSRPCMAHNRVDKTPVYYRNLRG